MLFSSPVFIFLFLPVVLIGFHILSSRIGRGAAAGWLVAASFFFYAWWNPRNLPILLASALFNYVVSVAMSRSPSAPTRRLLLTTGVCANLLLLAYFKYAHFLVSVLNQTAHTAFAVGPVVLPLGISFFTFTQIAYLVDLHRDGSRASSPTDYALFVTYFPHLIAGPIIHHREMMPQFSAFGRRFDLVRFTVGLTTFVLGLLKKVLIADSAASYVGPVFDAAGHGAGPQFSGAWLAALAYTVQIYFDFSGYSDMAIGLGEMFHIRLPVNFRSPYQATSIIDFWRRWHITLSRFLRDYLYIPLGGNRRGTLRRHLNLVVTMLLGGLWHGAGWTFVVWGGLHGAYLTVNHLWHALAKPPGWDRQFDTRPGRLLGGALTFVSVVAGWVVFRADDFSTAASVLRGMVGMNGITLPVFLEKHIGSAAALLRAHHVAFSGRYFPMDVDKGASLFIGALLLAAWLLPDTQDWMAAWRPAIDSPLPHIREASEVRKVSDPELTRTRGWGPRPLVAVVLGVCLFFALKTFFSAAPSSFIYFNF